MYVRLNLSIKTCFRIVKHTIRPGTAKCRSNKCWVCVGSDTQRSSRALSDCANWWHALNTVSRVAATRYTSVATPYNTCEKSCEQLSWLEALVLAVASQVSPVKQSSTSLGWTTRCQSGKKNVNSLLPAASGSLKLKKTAHLICIILL